MEKKSVASEFSSNRQDTNGFAKNGILLNAKYLEATQNGTVEKEVAKQESETFIKSANSVRLTIVGFLCGVLGSLLVATGISCAQVCTERSWKLKIKASFFLFRSFVKL